MTPDKDIRDRLREAMEALGAMVDELLERERRASIPARILLVDDDPNDVCMLCRLLDEFNCQVKICRTSEDALKAIAAESFDFVFLDQKMPRISGLEVLKQTLPNSNGTQFFVVSGFAGSAIADEVMRLGALYLPKPVTQKILATFLSPKNE